MCVCVCLCVYEREREREREGEREREREREKRGRECHHEQTTVLTFITKESSSSDDRCTLTSPLVSTIDDGYLKVHEPLPWSWY